MRTLLDVELEDLLSQDLVARLATIDADGYPHVTPIWFLWVDGTVYLTSHAGRPHLRRIAANPRVGLVIDTEDAQRADGERPNKQIRITGDASVTVDADSAWTQRIRAKYLGQTVSLTHARALITVHPRSIHAVASV